MPVEDLRITGKTKSHASLINQLVNELKRNSPPGKSKSSEPYIIIEPGFRDKLHVTVIWDKWKNLSYTDRAQIILDAFEKHAGKEEMLKITLPVGFTSDEAKEMDLLSNKAKD